MGSVWHGIGGWRQDVRQWRGEDLPLKIVKYLRILVDFSALPERCNGFAESWLIDCPTGRILKRFYCLGNTSVPSFANDL